METIFNYIDILILTEQGSFYLFEIRTSLWQGQSLLLFHWIRVNFVIRNTEFHKC